jgi:hypothetical protein
MGMLVTIERRRLDPDRLYGAVLARSPALLLLHEEYDFQFDGYHAIRTKDITLCESSESNDYCQRLMRREGLWERVPRWVKALSIEGWPELLAGLVGRVVSLEDEVKGTFHIGPVLEAKAKHVVIHYFDGCGRFQAVEKVSYGQLTSARFGNRYSTIHAKYLREKGQVSGPAHSEPRSKRKP